jgi:serine/threonine protein phosphatase PrpC
LKGGRVDTSKDQNGNPYGPERVWLSYIDIPGLAMTRSFGDKIAAQAGVIAEPEILEYEKSDMDKFIVLASDGVWEYLSNDDVMRIIVPFYERHNPDGAADKVIVEAS